MKENLHFLHIPKTGGTSLKNALRKNVDIGKYNIILHNHNVTLFDIPEKEKFFFCLRDPIERFISSFYGRLRCGRPSHISPHTPKEVKFFKEFKTPNQLAETISFTNEQERMFAFKAMLNIRHLRPQYSKFLISEMVLKQREEQIFYICKTENLNLDFEQLKIELGLPNTSLPTNDFNSNRRPNTLTDINLSELAISNLTKFYKPDYDILNYCDLNFINK